MSEIDPVEFGELRQAVAGLKDSNRELRQLVVDNHAETRKAMESIQSDFGDLMTIVHRGEGGWRVLLGVTGAAATLGSGITWLLHHLRGAP